MSTRIATMAALVLAPALAGIPSGSIAGPMPTHLALMKSTVDNETVQVRWGHAHGGWGHGGLGHGGWGHHGWANGGWGHRGWGVAAAGAVIGGALVGSHYGSYPDYEGGYDYGGYAEEGCSSHAGYGHAGYRYGGHSPVYYADPYQHDYDGW